MKGEQIHLLPPPLRQVQNKKYILAKIKVSILMS